jgi:hypothetical protein
MCTHFILEIFIYTTLRQIDNSILLDENLFIIHKLLFKIISSYTTRFTRDNQFNYFDIVINIFINIIK